MAVHGVAAVASVPMMSMMPMVFMVIVVGTNVWLIVAPVAKVPFRIIPLNGYLLSVVTVPVHQAPPLAGNNFRRNLEHESDKMAWGPNYHLASLADDGHGQVLHSFQSAFVRPSFRGRHRGWCKEIRS